MDRRSFMEMLGGTGMLAAASPLSAADEQRTAYYVLENYFLKNGTQLGRINEFMSKCVVPATGRLQPAPPRLCLEAVVAPHLPQFALITGYRSLEHMLDVRRTLVGEEDVLKAFQAWESGPEPPYEHYSACLLEAAPYSPEVVPLNPEPKTPRIFELRVYHSPTFRQLRALHGRFSGSEIGIFHRCGIHPVFYTSMMFGASMPNLTYLIPFENLAAREKAWAAFAADPEWVKVRQESIDKYGQISSVSQISLFKATPYSPVR